MTSPAGGSGSGTPAMMMMVSAGGRRAAAGSSGSTPTGGKGGGAGASSAAAGSNGVAPAVTPEIPVPNGGVDAEAAEPSVALPDAPALPGKIKYVPNRSSVVLYLPGVQGARDYRAYVLEDGVKVSADADKRVHVANGTLTCSGLRQRNQCDDGEVLSIKYNNDELDLPVCEVQGLDRRPNVPTQLMQTLELNGITSSATVVVEALDRQCPFPGLVGTTHTEYEIVGETKVDANINGKSYTLQRWNPKFPVRTEAEIRADYGSMIWNGQGPNLPTLDVNSPNFPESPYVRVAQPAPADDPRVLGRAVIKVTPLGNKNLPEGFRDQDYFDDFDDDSDQPKLLRAQDYTGQFAGLPVKVYQNKKWIFYDVANGVSDFFVANGQLNMVHADTAQGSMTTQAMYPKRAVKLPTADDRYLHVTYEVQRSETARRYENLALCGSDMPGETYDGETPKAAPLPRPGFMNEDDTARTSPLGWNCLMLVPRGEGYGVLPGGDINSHSDTGLKITVVKTHPAPAAPDYDAKHVTQYASAFGPSQEAPYPKRWLRQVDEAGKISGMWLDDVMDVWRRARFDVFIRRDQLVIYVNGEQRICQSLKGSPLTMSEGALGFWHVLYHTSAEFYEIRASGDTGSNPRTAQHHIMHNTPFADERSWDNVGFREDVPLPAGFNAGRCYEGP